MGIDKKFMLDLGNRIRRAREQAGITQEELADRVGISRTAIARYELGKIEPKLKNLSAISIQLNVSADYLLGIEHNMDLPIDLSEEALKALTAFVREVRK